MDRDTNTGNYKTYTRSLSYEYEAKLEFTQALSGDVGAQTSLRKYQLKSAQIEMKYQQNLDDLLAKSRKLQTLIQQGEKQLIQYLKQINLVQPFEQFRCQNFEHLKDAIDELDSIEALHEDYLTERHNLYQQQVDYDALLDRLLP